jgi:hypothetical protein
VKFPDHKQNGVVLLLLLLVFLITGSTVMLGSFNSRQDLYLKQQAELNNQMQLAKEALLAFAANSSAIYDNEHGPGFFPCPDTTNTGKADIHCDSSIVNLGRLPEYADIAGNKIYFNSHYADIDQQFWYALAPYHTYSASESDRSAVKRTFIDSTLPSSLLTLDDKTDIVALIIAPGEALDFQNRKPGSLAADDFLEGGNEDNDFSFFTSSATNSASFNDRIIAITHDELLPFIVSNAARAIKRQLDEDFDLQTVEPKHYPGNPDDLGQTPAHYHDDFTEALAGHHWLTDTSGPTNERWAMDTIYTLISATQASVQFKGCAGISFTLNHGGELIRNGTTCLSHETE